MHISSQVLKLMRRGRGGAGGRGERRESSGIDSYSAVRSQDHCGNYLNSCSKEQGCVVPQVTQKAADVRCHGYSAEAKHVTVPDGFMYK